MRSGIDGGGSRECENCGGEFTPDKFHPRQKWCSNRCRHRAFRESRGACSGPAARDCQTCGERFLVSKFNPHQKWCSQRCRDAPAPRTVDCPVCEQVFVWTKAHRIYCSEECARLVKQERTRKWRKERARLRNRWHRRFVRWVRGLFRKKAPKIPMPFQPWESDPYS